MIPHYANPPPRESTLRTPFKGCRAYIFSPVAARPCDACMHGCMHRYYIHPRAARLSTSVSRRSAVQKTPGAAAITRLTRCRERTHEIAHAHTVRRSSLECHSPVSVQIQAEMTACFPDVTNPPKAPRPCLLCLRSSGRSSSHDMMGAGGGSDVR